MIEMRENAYNMAFELLEKAMHNAKKTKLTLCELEDAMYDCYETSKENDPYEEEEEEPTVDFRRRGYRDDEDEDMNMRYRTSMRRRLASRVGMRMRRNRMGQYA